MRDIIHLLKPILATLCTVILGSAAISFTTSSRGRAAEDGTVSGGAYLGFDRDIYPGDAAFSALRTTFAFTSYWVGPPPGEKSTTWTGKRDFLKKQGFGFLVLYSGRSSREIKNLPDGRDKGTLDAQAAAGAAKKEGFPAGTIIFLDIEEGGRLPAAYHEYLHTWAAVLATNGYRAGVYCSGMPAHESGGVAILAADDIRANAGSHEFTFFVYNDACPPSPGCVFPGKPPMPSASGVAYAKVWQFAQSPRRKEFTVHCPPGYQKDGQCYSPGDKSLLWDLDVDTAESADPSSGARP